MSSIPRNRFIAICTVVALLVAAGAIWSGLRRQAETERSIPESASVKRPRPASPAPSGSLESAGEGAKTLAVEADPAREPDALTQRLEGIQNDPDAREWPGMLLDLMNTASMAEVRALLAASDGASNYPAAFREEMKVATFERWYHLDAAAALRAIAASRLPGGRKNSRMELHLEDWARRAPQEVGAFLEQGELGGVSPDVVYGALARGGATSGERAVFEDALGKVEESKKRNFTLRSIARTLQRDHEALFDAWVPTLSSEEQATALAEGGWMLVDKDPSRALERLDQLEKLGADELPVTRSRVVAKWTRQDPGNAGQWVLDQKLPEAERENLLSLVFKVWMSKDRDAAVAWAEDSIKRGTMDEALMNRVATRLQP